MAKVIVQNVFRYESLEFEIEPGLTLITGKNAAGKTSLSRVLATLVSGENNPSRFSGTQFGYYVRKGAGDGLARLDMGEDGHIEWRPKTGEVSIPEGMAYPFACPEAVNLVDFTAAGHGPTARAKMWEGLFVPGSPMELLAPAWEKAGRPVAALETLVEEIEKSGWNGAENIYVKKRAGAKSEWQLTTGAGTWGGDKAAKWVPPKWDSELEDESLESLEAQLVNARDILDRCVVKVGVDQAAIDAASKLKSEQYDPALEELKKAVAAVEAARGVAIPKETERNAIDDELEKRRVQHDRLQMTYARAKATLGSSAPFTCPHCDGGLKTGPGPKMEVVKWEAPDAETRAKAEDTIKRADEWFAQYSTWTGTETAKRTALTLELSKLVDAEREAEAHERECRAKCEVLAPQIALAEAEPEEGRGSESERQHAENVVENCRERIRMWKQWTDAGKAHNNVVEYDFICKKILGPAGVRVKLLDEALGNVNKLLANICKTAGWPKTEITPAYDVMVDDWPLQASAESILLRTQWAMEIVFARYRKSDWLILDKGDHLRDESWDGLMELLVAFAKARPHMHIVLAGTSIPFSDLGGGDWTVLNVDTGVTVAGVQG